MVEPFPMAKMGQHFALVAIDFSTRWPIAWATIDYTVETINCFIYKEIILNYNNPDYLVTDMTRELVG